MDTKISGSLTVTARPIRFAFVTDCTNRQSVAKCVEYATMLWGGVYSPIIPFEDLQPNISYIGTSNTFEKESIFNRYINYYNPDILVTVGVDLASKFLTSAIKTIKDEDLFHRQDNGLMRSRFSLDAFDLATTFINENLLYTLRWKRSRGFEPFPVLRN